MAGREVDALQRMLETLEREDIGKPPEAAP